MNARGVRESPANDAFYISTRNAYLRFIGEISGYVYEFFINFDEESLGVMVKTLILASIDIKS